jgi:hypothetical protein
MILSIYANIIYFVHLTLTSEVLWIILPLGIATVAMIMYFERYKDEMPGWNTYFSNSLVLLFISIILFRFIYNIDGHGAYNFVDYWSKTTVAAAVLIVGINILVLNFKHFLPEKIAMKITSPITLNLLAYIAILFVYSEVQDGWSIFLALVVIFLVLLIVLHFVRIGLSKLFVHLKRMKDQEKREAIVQDKKPIAEKKKEVKKEEKIVKAKKKEVKKEEKKIEKKQLRKLDKQKKEAIKLKKVVKK